MKTLLLLGIVLFCRLAQAQTYTEIQKIVASDRTETARFGQSVAIDGNYAVVGAYGAGSFNTGKAYIYEYTGGTWVETQILTNSDHENYDRFGWSVAIDGDYIVIGAPSEDDDELGNNNISKTGSAYIFKNIAGTWTEVQKIIASDRSTEDEFGWSVDIDDSTLIVGAHQDFEDENGLNPIHHAGSVYIFDLDGTGTWNQSQKVVASDRALDIVYPNGHVGEDLSDQFGHTIGLSGDYMIIGALNHDYRPDLTSAWQCGSAYVFERSGGTWVQVQQIINADNASSGGWERFGSDVAIDSNYIAVGMWAQDFTAAGTDYMKNAGAVYIFERDGAGTWNETQKLVAGMRNTGDHFGWDVKINGDMLITGTEHDDHDENEVNPLLEAGSAYIFARDGGGTYTQTQKIRASDRDSLDIFGYAVDIQGNNAIVGAFQHDFNVAHIDSLDEAGAVYLFSACSGSITSTQDTTVCFGGSVTVGDSLYTNDGSYTNVLTTIHGCDSTVTTNLTVLANIVVNQTITICNTASYTIGTSTYNTEGTFTDVLTSVLNGCDSTVITTLVFHPDNGISQTITICDGGSYSIGTSTYIAEGTYSDVFTSSLNGCDSTVNTTIVFYTPIIVNQNVSICPGQTYMVGTSTYNVAGNFTDILTSVVNGCDSTVNTTITESIPFEISQNINVCYGESYAIGSSTYTTPGNFTDTLTMIDGFCDSIVHTNLTVNLPIDISLDINGNDIESNENGSVYQWVDCPAYSFITTNTTANQQEFTATESGDYAVILNSSGCIDTSACVHIDFVGLNENYSAQHFEVYPNPNHGSFSIQTDFNAPYNLIILNSLGEMVYADKLISDKTYLVEGLNLANGMYFIELTTNNQRLIKKISVR